LVHLSRTLRELSKFEGHYQTPADTFSILPDLLTDSPSPMIQDPELLLTIADTRYYRCDATHAFCACSGSAGVFPRSGICVSGVVVHLREIQRRNVLDRPDIRRICVPSSVETICRHGFGRFEGLSTVVFEFGSRLACIEVMSFRYCHSLSAICIPSSVERLNALCFSECWWLSTVTFEPGSKVSSIGTHAFYACRELSSICLPSGLRHLGHSALPDRILESLSIPDGNCNICLYDHLLLAAQCTSVTQYFGHDEEVTIRKSIEQLDDGCFKYRGSVQRVVFEAGSRLLRIGPYAFAHCSGLSSISIPASVEKLCEYCLSACESLRSVTFESPSKVSYIGGNAFWRSSSLQSICIPSSVEQLCRSCFSGCDSLSTVIFQSGSKLSRIENSAFYACPLASICIPASVRDFCPGCLYGCYALVRVTLERGSRFSRIPDSAFSREQTAVDRWKCNVS
jgi:hypothetical protein